MSRAEKPRHAREAPYLLRVSNRKAAVFSRIIKGLQPPDFSFIASTAAQQHCLQL